MLRHSPVLFAVLVSASVFMSACASLEPPRIQVQRLGRPQMGLSGATLDVTFSVRNPNPDAITIERVQYDLFLNGRRVGDGFVTRSTVVPGFGEARVSSSFDINYLRLPGAVKSIMDLDRVDARTTGRFFMRKGEGGRLRKVGFASDATLDFNKGPRPQ